MNFNAPLLKPFRMLLFPFSLVYAAAVWMRNRMFDNRILGSSSFNLPLVCVGNLSVGGTGKSPMVEFLARKLQDQYKLAALSRGYKRKTKGYALANEESTALDIGDEPMLLHQKFPAIAVAVGEERIVAIPQLLHDRPETQVIILDDAFQHRTVKAGLNILLTDYNNLFTRDWFLPTGDLRDERASYKRAEVLVVTKSPAGLTEEEASKIAAEINVLPHQSIFFTSIDYGMPYHLLTKQPYTLDEETEVLLVTGIANPGPIEKYLLDKTSTYHEMIFSDHHIFTIDDLKEIQKRFQAIQAEKKLILTTEKDAVRLVKFSAALSDVPVFALPITIKFLFNAEERFLQLISTFIDQYHNHYTNVKETSEEKEN